MNTNGCCIHSVFLLLLYFVGVGHMVRSCVPNQLLVAFTFSFILNSMTSNLQQFKRHTPCFDFIELPLYLFKLSL